MMNGMQARLSQLVSTLSRILITPASNMKAALLLYAAIALFLLFILVIGIMFVMAAPGDEAAAAVPRVRRKDIRVQRRAASPMSRRMRWLLGVAIAVLLLGAWVAAGFTTSDSGLCRSCHASTFEHAKADKGSDPHAQLACVSCHEAGGIVGRYVTGVPFRLLHLAMASAGAGNDVGYGRATTRACTSCHVASLSGTTTNAERGLKMSHAEPLAASAICVDCHIMRNGIVGAYTAGMKPCLRCHDDDKASAACTTCHTGQTAAAASAETTSFQNVQIREVSCAGCHDEKRKCDPCHGLRMPHTGEFRGHAHARAAAVDLWYNGGKTCGRCHTASRRPCSRCHSTMMGRAHGTTQTLAASHQHASSASCNTCHQKNASISTRDFCKDVCHDPAAIEASPR
jgi:hypothetical protein